MSSNESLATRYPSNDSAAVRVLPNGFKRSMSSHKTTAKSDHVVRNSLLAGSLAGVTSTLAFYPTDLLRTKMQASSAVVASSSKPACPTSGSPLTVLTHTLQNGGIRALYTGLALPLTAQAVYKATVFSVNNVTTKFIQEYRGESPLSQTDRFVCGFVGGAVNAALFVTPVEFVRNQLIAQHTRKANGKHKGVCFKGPRDVIRHTFTTNGVQGLWRGATMAIARDAFGCGCFFWTFHYVQAQRNDNSLSTNILAGACSGLAFWLVALPLDTVKTWVQNGSACSGRIALRESLSEHGLAITAQRLCRGWQVAYGRGAPAAAVTICTYQWAYTTLTN